MLSGTDLAERGWLPDLLIRFGIRQLLAARIREELRLGCEGLSHLDRKFVAEIRQSPIAIHTASANDQHYEVPAAYFDLVLGPHRKYSSCLWPDGVTDLGAAEQAMLEQTCQRAELTDGMDLLELGCGWGSLSLFMAQRYPQSRIEAVSNSASQRQFIMTQAAARGLTNLTIHTCDMVDFQTSRSFDRVVSIEMFEHMRNYDELFARIARWLKPHGKLFTHVFYHGRCAYPFETDGQNAYVGRNLILSNITTFDVGADTKVRNIFGFTSLKANSMGDIDGMPYGIDSNGPGGGKNDLTKQVSEELQLAGKALGGNLNYVIGAFYSHETNVDLTTSLLLDFPPLTSTTVYHKKTTRDMIAGYGQATYDLSDATGIKGLGFTLGARFTHEKIKFDVLSDDTAYQAPPAVQATYNFHQTKSFGNVSWTIGLQDQITPDLLVYVASRRSYKNGGYNGIQNPVPGPGSQGGNGYGRETLTDVELGLKYRGMLGTMPVTFNVAGYQNWIKDGQRVAYTLLGSTPAAVTVNVPRSKISGFELDTSIRPADWLSIGGSVNYTNARFTDNLVSIGGGAPVAFGTYPDTPEWSGGAYAEVNVPLMGSISGTLRGDVYSQSLFWFSSTGNNNTGAHIDGYTLANFRIGIQDEKAGWSLSANLKNAFNRTYYVGGIATGELFQFNTVVPGAPRTFMAELRYKF